MDRWLPPALDYALSWLEFQMRHSALPGCIVAVAERDRVVLEHAFGHADLARGEKLTPRHRFRIASHSKSLTGAGIMKLREANKLRLDDPVSRFVSRLHPRVAEAMLAQVDSHSAGLMLSANPYLGNPFMDATEMEISGRDKGRITLANGYNSHGEGVRLVRDKSGAAGELRFGATLLRSEAAAAAAMRRKYGGRAGSRRTKAAS